MDINGYPVLSAQEAAALVQDGETVSFSGFSPAGAAKVVPAALAARAREEYQKREPVSKIRVLTGASSGRSTDEDLADAGAIKWRGPYQSGVAMRRRINCQALEYVDMHLSHLPQAVAGGILGRIGLAVVEATEITADGRVYLTTSIGASPTYLNHADRVVIELNDRQSPRLREMADIFSVPPPPNRASIPIHTPLTRIGWPYAQVDPKKVVGVVLNNEADLVDGFSLPDDKSVRIAAHLVAFFRDEIKAGRIPEGFLPLQAGVGNLANGVMTGLGADPDMPKFTMYSEVFQNAMVDLMLSGKLLGASATSLTITADKLDTIIKNIGFFAPRIVLRPQEISNNPGIIRQLGVIAINTALEFDIYGNVNSSHLFGTDIVNGIGGSGDFTRNSYLSIFIAPSEAKDGKLSKVVPMCPHIDSSEHSVQVLVTEQGLADLRGLGPVQRARRIIETCAHPLYRPYLEKYIRESRQGHIPHQLDRCFELHRNFLAYGNMLPDAG